MTTAPLFVVDSVTADPQFVLDGDEGRHAARVKRLTAGERVTVSDGHGAVLDCEVTDVLPDALRLTVLARRAVPEPRPRLVVVQALAKGERAELAVELMTELGVDEIVPWAASRSITQWHGPRGEKARAKWQRIAREAAKQSRRPWVPGIAPLADTAALTDRLGAGLVLHEDAAEPIGSAALPPTNEIVVVVGPEGGITPDELDAFAGAGARAVRLGEPVLRTSTAGAAALAALSLRLGRWGGPSAGG